MMLMNLVCLVKTDPSPLIWNEEIEIACIKQMMETTGSCVLFSSGTVLVLMLIPERGRRAEVNEKQEGGRPDLEGSSREENSQTKIHEADLHTGTELRTKNSFIPCHKH